MSNMLFLNRYQWQVLLAAWLGWGLDLFDIALFNYIAPNCISNLLGLPIGSPEANAAILEWNNFFTVVIPIAWAVGGLLFARLADRIGHSKIAIATIVVYAFGTIGCAFAPNISCLMLWRIVANLGIGGEWAVGASLITEAIPKRARLKANAILFTAAPISLLLAHCINDRISEGIIPQSPQLSWRFAFIGGLILAECAFLARIFIQEGDCRQKITFKQSSPKFSELFNRQNFTGTIASLVISSIALFANWSIYIFVPIVTTNLANIAANDRGLDDRTTLTLAQHWQTVAIYSLAWGSLIGALSLVFTVKQLGRKNTFTLYLFVCAVSTIVTFGLPLPPSIRLHTYFAIGIGVNGVLGSLAFYLPELFSMRLRATACGFCYNLGRVVGAICSFLLLAIASDRTNFLETVLPNFFSIAAIALSILVFLPWVVQIKGLGVMSNE
ncbi:MAG: MFS transporter [Xenococcaceae cyanobacterium]